MSPKDRAADLRLRRIYGITLAEYNRKLKEQAGRCAICRRPPRKLRLGVDHNHAIERTKVLTAPANLPGGKAFVASAFVTHDGKSGVTVTGLAETKAEAIAQVKLKLKRRSVRGLLCMICNRKVLGSMERFKVRPDAVQQYLQYHDPNNPLVVI
jgi:hypothetical protein